MMSGWTSESADKKRELCMYNKNDFVSFVHLPPSLPQCVKRVEIKVTSRAVAIVKRKGK